MTLQSAKPGEIYYSNMGSIQIIRVIDRYPGYKEDSGYKDPNGDTIEFYDIIEKKNDKINSRGNLAQRFNDCEGREHYVIEKIFKHYG